MRGLCWVALVLGCRPVPDTGGEFFEARAEIFCERLEACDEVTFNAAYGSPDACVEAKRVEQDRQNEGCDYDPSLALECLRELEDLPCERVLGGLECTQAVMQCP